MNVAQAAYELASWWHRGQKRKYTGEPYISHPLEVAGIIATYESPFDESVPLRVRIATALLHDTVEDQGEAQGVTREVIEHCLHAKFAAANQHVHLGLEYEIQLVGAGVEALTDPAPAPGLNRAKRKQMTRIRLRDSPGWIQGIKCGDIVSNAKSIVQHDPNFAHICIPEMQALVNGFAHVNPAVLEHTNKVLHQCQHKLLEIFDPEK